MTILSFSQVSKTFGSDHTVLDGVSFSVEAGELVILTGPSGSGKTTIMKLLTREYSVTSGEIFFHDTPVHSLKLSKVHTLRRQLGVVYQDYRLIRDMNVWENIATPLYIAGKKDADTEQRVSDLLNLIALTDKADAFPSQLSGGEAQRVAIARALALGPDLIFADEPTGNLDALTSKGIANLLGKINELGTTIIIATHDLTLLDIFLTERHLQLADGKIQSDQQKKRVQKDDSPGSELVHTEETMSTKPTAEPQAEPELHLSEETRSEANPPEKVDQAVTMIQTENPQPESVTQKKSLWHRLKLVKKPTHTAGNSQKSGDLGVEHDKSASKQPKKHQKKHQAESRKKS